MLSMFKDSGKHGLVARLRKLEIDIEEISKLELDETLSL